MAVQRESNKVFNRPVGVVKAPVLTGESDSWQTLSDASKSLSTQYFRKAVDEAKLAGSLEALNVDIIDDNGNIKKANVSAGMGTIGTQAFEQTILSRYEKQIAVSVSNKVNESLSEFPNDPDKFNESATTKLDALINSIDPSFKGFVKDYSIEYLARGNNTVAKNKQDIENRKKVSDALDFNQLQLGQALNYIYDNNFFAGDSILNTLEADLTDLVNERILTAQGADEKIAEYRRILTRAKLGVVSQDLNSVEIQMALVNTTDLESLLDPKVMGFPNDEMFNEWSQKITPLINVMKESNLQHPLDAESLRQSLTTIQNQKSELENKMAKDAVNVNVINKLNNGELLNVDGSGVPKKHQDTFNRYVFNQAGVEYSDRPSAADIFSLIKNKEFHRIIREQNQLPTNIIGSFRDMVRGGGESNTNLALMELYQNFRNVVSQRGMSVDMTSLLGMDGTLATQLKGIDQMLTFNSTPDGIQQAIQLANASNDDRIQNLITEINRTRPDYMVTNASGVESYFRSKLLDKIDDGVIVQEVLHETMLLAGFVGVPTAIEMIIDTVDEKWKESKYTVDWSSGSTLLRTRYSPEQLFGKGEVLDLFEAEVIKLSGLGDKANLGENLFVMADPNSEGQNIRYHIMVESDYGGVQPVIIDGKNAIINSTSFIDKQSEEYKKKMKDNREWLRKISTQKMQTMPFAPVLSIIEPAFGANPQAQDKVLTLDNLKNLIK